MQNDPVRKKTDKIEELPNYYHILLPNHYNYQCGKMLHFPTHSSANRKQPRGSDGSRGCCYVWLYGFQVEQAEGLTALGRHQRLGAAPQGLFIEALLHFQTSGYFFRRYLIKLDDILSSFAQSS